MKRKLGKNTYEVFKNGKPLGAKAETEAWMAFIPRWVRFIAIASFPVSFGKEAKDLLRAVTFSVDEAYTDTVIKAVEKKWPSTTTKGERDSRTVKGKKS